MKLRAYIHHKRAERYSDCQDCFGVNSESNRIAISDGMSQSIYPQWWAKILVDAYLNKGTLPIDLECYQKIWQEKVNDEILKRESDGKDPWRLKNSVAEKSGAGATLCGITWSTNSWRCECLGDSCLITVNHNYELHFHTSQVGEFGNHPDYYDSFGDGKGNVQYFSGNFNDMIVMLLVTDPFSELFQKYETDKDFIKNRIAEILSMSDHKSFVELVEMWRDKFDMHNDDSTLIILDDFDCIKLDYINIDNLEQLCQEEQNVELSHEDSIFLVSEIGTQKNTIAYSEALTANKDVNTILINAFTEWLNHYCGKMSNSKIKNALWNLVQPIVKEFIKMDKNK